MDILNIIPQDIWTTIAQTNYNTFKKLYFLCKTLHNYLHETKNLIVKYYPIKMGNIPKYNTPIEETICVIKYNSTTIKFMYKRYLFTLPIVGSINFTKPIYFWFAPLFCKSDSYFYECYSDGTYRGGKLKK